MKIIESTEAGFFANVCDVIRHIHQAEIDKDKWCVNWSSNSPYFDIHHGKNVWEYFFVQEYQPNDYWLDPNQKTVRGYIDVDMKGSSFRNRFHYLAKKYLALNSVTTIRIARVAAANQDWDKTLGVHIRYTDKHNGAAYGEPLSSQPIPIAVYLHLARQALRTGYEKIYLATDCHAAFSAFQHEFGGALISLDAPRSNSTEPIHTGHPHVSGYNKALSVLTDTLMLAKCAYLIRSTSNVSSFAQFLNLNLQHLNVNEVFAGDTREQEYGLKSSDFEHLIL